MSKNKKKGEAIIGKPILRILIKNIFSEKPNKVFTYKQIASTIGVKNMETKRMIVEVLDEMSVSGKILPLSNGRYKGMQVKSYIIGKVELTAKGSAYIISDEIDDDVFVSFNNLNHSLNGDIVKVLVYARSKNRRPEGEVVEIIERNKHSVVGIIRISDNYAFLEPTGKQLPYDIFIPSQGIGKAQNGQKVVVTIKSWAEGQKNPVGRVTKILGYPGDNDTEMNAIMAEFELPVEFPDSVQKASDKIPETISSEEIAGRRDFRDIITFTIDPKDAKDFDDALSIREVKSGIFEIGIHIADVTHYVDKKSVIEKEAYSRATSVYLVDRTIPMLPERLSNGLCSLRPNEDKLCFSVVVEMNQDGDIISEWIGRTIINSNRRFAYEEAQAIIEGADGDYKKEILKLDEFAKILRKERFKNGAIEFNRVEVRFDIDENGKPIDVYFKESKDANKLIEEFMLLANKKVAERIGKDKKGRSGAKTFVYRIHDKPTLEKLTDLNLFVSKFGHSINMRSSSTIIKSLNNLMAEVKNKPEQNVVETLAIRTMSKAAYSTENIRHYGLAFPYYSHFTSPIRRYPDMMVHRLLTSYLEGGRSANKDKYEDMCIHSSEMEQLAANAERASIKYKQVEYMKDRLGQTFEGTISGVTNWGFFVEIDESKCEGLVSMHVLEDDLYEFDEKNYCIIGRHTKKRYQLGDKVNVVVLKANLESRQLDFGLKSDTKVVNNNTKEKNKKKRKK